MKRTKRAPAGRRRPRTPAREPAARRSPEARAAVSGAFDVFAGTIFRCACGGDCPRCRDGSGPEDTLDVSRPGDPLEREADRIAERVLRTTPAEGDRDGVARLDGATAPAVQRLAGRGGASSSSPDHGGALAGLGSGRPLDGVTRTFFEPRFGHDFGAVRVHADAAAADAARVLNARAFTVRSDVVFGAGEYSPGTAPGRRLLAHELTHVVQQGAARPSATSVAPGVTPAARRTSRAAGPVVQRQPAGRRRAPQPAPCTPREPRNCPTYEQWLHAFHEQFLRDPAIRRRHTFVSGDGVPGGTVQRFRVLGAGPASRDPAAPAADRPPPRVGVHPGDRFIDHPTDRWVRRNLPANLRSTAYELPSDCADIVVILRHVWLSAHHRTERYRGWWVGDAAGRAAQRRVGRAIRTAWTGNLERMVNPYSDTSGDPIRSFAALQDLLHPGDILVWAHHGNGLNRRSTGGHSQTIAQIERDDTGRITSITVLQGNQPLFRQQAVEIRRHLRSQGQRRIPSERRLRNAPGRRIEVSELSGRKLSDTQLPRRRGSARPPRTVWTWNDAGNTILVAAGPPRAARRPRMRRRGGRRVRRLTDWLRALSRAARTRLQGVFEAALQEARALIEGGGRVSNSDASALGETAGERLWKLARRSVRRFRRRGGERGDRGERSHFDLLHRIRAAILALGGIRPPLTSGNPNAGRVRATFRLIDDEFNFAARGGTDISFGRRVGGRAKLVRVLLTGFDPFHFAGSPARSVPPPAGAWNPSGAAVLALDGRPPLSLGGRAYAIVEGVVLPVSWEQFRAGIVERVLGQAPNADAVITVSMAGMPVGQPVRIEQFAVGVHDIRPVNVHRLFPTEHAGVRRLEAIPSAPGGPFGPAIMETRADVRGIAQDTARRRRGRRSAIPQPTIGTDITFLFGSATDARDALSALGTTGTITPRGGAGGAVELRIDDPAALARIIRTAQRVMRRTGSGPVPTSAITFRVGNRRFRAQVLEGPGGDFLSNEVFFRVQRELRRTGSQALSFHVHTPRAPLIPQGRGTRAARRTRRTALGAARRFLRNLITTLERIVRATARRIIAARAAGGSGTP